MVDSNGDGVRRDRLMGDGDSENLAESQEATLDQAQAEDPAGSAEKSAWTQVW